MSNVRRPLGYLASAAVGLAILALAGSLIFGTSRPPPELTSVSSPFKTIDFSDAPALQRLAVPAGGSIAYRRYGPGAAKDAVIAMHGSSGSSLSLHVLAKTLSNASIEVFLPDVRGHGDTGRRGDVDYAGQLDDDLTAMIAHVRSVVPNARLTLVGFSMSGGLVLRNAGGANGGLIDRSILISPMLGPGAPTMKPPREDAWAAPHIPRIMALSAINRIGVTALDGLEAIAYAVPPGSAWVQTGSYSWRLLRSFFPHNYAESLRAAPKPIAILVGERDELFRVDAFAPAVQQVRADVPVTVVAGIDHINMTLDAKALSALLQALQ